MALNAKSLSFISSNKGNPLLLLDGFLYKINKETEYKKYWICHCDGCKAYAHTDINNQLMKLTGEHIHLPQPEDLEIKRFREKVKCRVVNETTPIMKIYEEEVIKSDFSAEVLASLPMAREIRECKIYKDD